MAVEIQQAHHATPYIRKKKALTSPTNGGRSVGIVRSRTKAADLLAVVPLFIHTFWSRKNSPGMDRRGAWKCTLQYSQIHKELHTLQENLYCELLIRAYFVSISQCTLYRAPLTKEESPSYMHKHASISVRSVRQE
jgi:hypothetical protein